ncbi:MAG: CopG family transcriptional regulator [Halorhabdus sp.]
MPTRFSVVLDDDRAREIRDLARQYDLTEEEVIRQLLELGIDELGFDRPEAPRDDDTRV